MDMHRTPSASSGELHKLGLTAAARAIRNGEVSSEDLIGRLLQRARAHADLNAFMTTGASACLHSLGTLGPATGHSRCPSGSINSTVDARPGTCASIELHKLTRIDERLGTSRDHFERVPLGGGE